MGTGCLTLLGFLLNILFISVSPSQGLKVNHLLKVPVGFFYCQILNVFHLNWTRGKTDDVCVRIIGMYTMDNLTVLKSLIFILVLPVFFCLWMGILSCCSAPVRTLEAMHFKLLIFSHVKAKHKRGSITLHSLLYWY